MDIFVIFLKVLIISNLVGFLFATIAGLAYKEKLRPTITMVVCFFILKVIGGV